jgi:S1-C subfamily serine protease
MCKKFFPPLFILLLLLVAVGATSVVATIWTGNYLDRYSAALLKIEEKELQIAKEKPRALPGTFEEVAALARETLLPAVAEFYEGNASGIVRPDFALGLGIVVTSDGWVLTTRQTLGDFSQKIGGLDSVRVAVDERLYGVASAIFDTLTDAVLVKLSDAESLPVVPFGASELVEAADLAFAALGNGALLPTAISNARVWANTAPSAQAERAYFVFDFVDAEKIPVGAPAVNSASELVAVDSFPLHILLPFVRSVIRTQSVERASLGADIMDLSFVMIGPSADGFPRAKGALVTAVDVQAAEAGLRVGDVVLEIDGGRVNGLTNLAEWLLFYKPGDTVRLLVDRKGTELEIQIMLKALPS